MTGKYLQVTLDMKQNGEFSESPQAKVGLTDISGLTLSEADPIGENVTDYIVSWNGQNDLSSLIGKVILYQVLFLSFPFFSLFLFS